MLRSSRPVISRRGHWSPVACVLGLLVLTSSCSGHSAASSAQSTPTAGDVANASSVFYAVPRTPLTAGQLATSADDFQQRIKQMSFSATVMPDGPDLRIAVAKPFEIAAIKQIVTAYSQLSFRSVYGQAATTPGSTADSSQAQPPSPAAASSLSASLMDQYRTMTCPLTEALQPSSLRGYVLGCDSSGTRYLLGPAIIDGGQMTNVEATTSYGQWVVNLDFDSSAASAYQQLTAQAYAEPACSSSVLAHPCNEVALTLGHAVLVAATSDTASGVQGGQVAISGNYTQQTATKLAAEIKDQLLPTDFTVTSTAPSGASSLSTTAASSPSPGSPATRYIGTLDEASTGTDIMETVNLGALRYADSATPPTDIFSDCNEDYEGEVNNSAFAQGELTLRYGQGTQPSLISITGEGNFGGAVDGSEPLDAQLAVQIDGQWQCSQSSASESDGVNVTLQPGQVVRYPIWLIFPGASSNAQPRFTRDELDTFGWQGFGSDQLPPNPSAKITGPQAANCEGTSQLLPFAQLPFSVAEGGGNFGCRAA